MQWIVFLLSLCAIVGGAIIAEAEEISFTDEELARESVLPVFDRSTATKRRNVTTEGKIDLGAYAGLNLNEAFFSQSSFGLMTSYHFSELRAIHFTFHAWTSGLSNYASQLQKKNDTRLDLYKAPEPKYYFLLDYERKFFYGKMSLAKNWISNLIIFASGGGGGITIGEKLYPVVSVGIGESIYWTRNFSTRLDLRLLSYMAPDYLSKNLKSESGSVPASEFDTHLTFGMILTFGFVYLFPSFY